MTKILYYLGCFLVLGFSYWSMSPGIWYELAVAGIVAAILWTIWGIYVQARRYRN